MSADRPLWEVMYAADAYCTPADDYREEIATVIRAVRDWLVPEEGPAYRNNTITSHVQWARRDARAELRALLTAEADRAERGDHSTSENV